jgi:hypothetical protein
MISAIPTRSETIYSLCNVETSQCRIRAAQPLALDNHVRIVLIKDETVLQQ